MLMKHPLAIAVITAATLTAQAVPGPPQGRGRGGAPPIRPEPLAMADHADHIHVGYMPVGSEANLSKQFESILKPDQWKQLVGRIAEIHNPTVPTKPSKFAIPTHKHGDRRASGAHVGE